MTVDRWGTVSDVVTALAAVIFAIAGGLWAWFRFRRQAPDLPRVNSSIDLQCTTIGGVDYVSWVARIEHLAGAPLAILQRAGKAPRVSIAAMSKSAETGATATTDIARVEVLRNHQEVAASEYVVDSGVAANVEAGHAVGYEVRFNFCGEWKRKVLPTKGTWTFECSNVLLRSSQDASPPNPGDPGA